MWEHTVMHVRLLTLAAILKKFFFYERPIKFYVLQMCHESVSAEEWEWWMQLSDGSLRGLPLTSSVPSYLFISFSPPSPGQTDSLTGRTMWLTAFLSLGPTEFPHCKEVQISRVFTSDEMLTNRKKEHINDAQLRKVISSTLLAAHY